MIKTARIPIRRPFVLPSFAWVLNSRAPAGREGEAGTAISDRKRETFAASQRDAIYLEALRAGYRHLL